MEYALVFYVDWLSCKMFVLIFQLPFMLPKFEETYARSYCFSANYIYYLLVHGYKFNEDTWPQIHFQKEVSFKLPLPTNIWWRVLNKVRFRITPTAVLLQLQKQTGSRLAQLWTEVAYTLGNIEQHWSGKVLQLPFIPGDGVCQSTSWWIVPHAN